MMRSAALVAVLALLALPARAQQQQVETLWNCKDKDGRTILTNQQSDTVGRDCRIVHQQRVNVVPATPAPKPATKPAAGFPKEGTADRAATRAKQREILERELTQEQAMLEDARRKLAEQEAIRTGDEKNYARVLERLRPFRDAVEVHEKNIEALKRELANLYR